MKHIYIFILVIFAGPNYLIAQSTPTKNALRAQVNHIAMYVHDLQESTAFYEKIIGLNQIPEPFHDGRHTWFSLGAAGQLHLIQGAAKEQIHDKNSHLCFSVRSIEDFIENLDKHQIVRENWAGDSSEPNVRVDGVKQIYFQDPDGYWIEINTDYSSSQGKDY